LFLSWASRILLLINFHAEPLGIIKLDASSREAGQDSGINFVMVYCKNRWREQSRSRAHAT